MSPSGAPPPGRGPASTRSRLSAVATAVSLFVVSLAFYSWDLSRPSPWRDEAVTYDVARRSVAEILSLTRQVDLVHLLYYLIGHFCHLFFGGFLALRLLSAVAFSCSTVVIYQVGRELGSRVLGVSAAIFLLLNPATTQYAQQARPYALVAMLGSVSLLLLLKAQRQGGLLWAAYSLTVLACAWLNILSLLLLPGHGLVASHHRDRFRRWGVGAAPAVLGSVPLLVLASRQSSQVSWLSRPGLRQLADVARFGWSNEIFFVGVLVLGVIAAALVARLRKALVVAIACGWLPVLLLWGASQIHPFFDGRYLVVCLPGMALGMGLSVLAPISLIVKIGRGRPTGGLWLTTALSAVGVVSVVAALSVYPDQVRMRAPEGVEDLRGVAAVLSQQARPGDAVLYVPSSFRLVAMMFPTPTSGLRDLALAKPGRDSATLTGVDLPAGLLRNKILDEARVWVVTRPDGPTASDGVDAVAVAVLSRCFVARAVWQRRGFSVREYLRSAEGTAGCLPSPG